MNKLQSTVKSLNLSMLAMILVLGPGLAGHESAHAAEIYHWVDANGVHHFSQEPPPSASGGVETLEVDGSQPASYDPEEDRYNIAAQEAAMQELRDELAENRKNQQEAQQTSTQNTVVYYPDPNAGNQILYPPGYRPYPPNWPSRPKPPYRPDRPNGKPDRPGTLPEETPAPSRPYKPRL